MSQAVRYEPFDPDLVAGVVECPAVFTEGQESALTTGEHQGVRVGGQLGMEPAPDRFRHWHVTIPLCLGANVKVVQRLLGHATAAMTLDRYGHLLNDDLTGVADALGKAIESTAVSLRYLEQESDP
jgi:integrase